MAGQALSRANWIAALSVATSGVFAEASGYHQGPINIKVDGKTLQLNVAALKRGLVTSSEDANSITMTWGDQARAFVVKDAMDDMPAGNYFSFNLLGKQLSYEVDLSTVGCSCNAALFFTAMPGYNANGTVALGDYNPYYCDANQVGGVWCWEHDSIESNMYALTTTPHTCNAPPGGYISDCDKVGCGSNSYWADPNGLCPAERCTIDTRKKFRVQQQHIVDPKSQKMVRIVNTLIQEGRTFSWDICPDKPLYAEAMTASMKDMKMVFQLWGDSYETMTWLDSFTGCQGACNTDTAYVTFSDIEIKRLQPQEVDSVVLYY